MSVARARQSAYPSGTSVISAFGSNKSGFERACKAKLWVTTSITASTTEASWFFVARFNAPAKVHTKKQGKNGGKEGDLGTLPRASPWRDSKTEASDRKRQPQNGSKRGQRWVGLGLGYTKETHQGGVQSSSTGRTASALAAQETMPRLHSQRISSRCSDEQVAMGESSKEPGCSSLSLSAGSPSEKAQR